MTKITPTTSAPLTIEQLSSMAAPILKKYGVRSAAVFGSVARGESGPDSDVDLLVDFFPGASLFTQAALQIELSRILKRQVDVVTRKSLKSMIRPHVLGDQKAIYG